MASAMYLRKSRADREAEARGEGETLARHEAILTSLAAKMDITIGAVYKEIVSGETIAARPRMQQLLLEVMQGRWDRSLAAGKEMKKKSLSEIAMQYGYVYVAQVAMGANTAQTLKAIAEAEAYHGPSLIIGYAPCEMHSIKGGMMNCQKEMKKAVDCGYWNLFRFNPALAAEGKNPFALDSKAPAGGYQEFLLNEARYSSLTRSFPDRAKVLFAKNEESAKARYEHLLKLVEMYK